MRFRVEWEDVCFATIAELLDGGMDADRLMFSVQWLEFELCENPGAKGQTVSEGLRRIDAPAIRAYFHVEAVESLVKKVMPLQREPVNARHCCVR